MLYTSSDCLFLQDALNKISEWCTTWKLNLNPNKCSTLSISLKKPPVYFNYSINSSPLNRVSSVKDLGILTDHKLNFVDHIQAVKAKAMSLLGLLYRFTEIKDTRALQSDFSTVVLPIISFCSPIWSMAAPSNLNTLNSVAHFFGKIVRHRVPSLRNMSTDDILSSLSIRNLSTLRLQTDLKFMYNILNSVTDCPDLLSNINFRVPSRITRTHSLFYTPVPRLSLTKRSLFFRLSSLLNSLPDKIDPFSLSSNSFTNLALSHLSENN